MANCEKGAARMCGGRYDEAGRAGPSIAEAFPVSFSADRAFTS